MFFIFGVLKRFMGEMQGASKRRRDEGMRRWSRGAREVAFWAFLPRLKETVSSNICWRIWAELLSIGAPLWNKGKQNEHADPFSPSPCGAPSSRRSACSFSSEFWFFLFFFLGLQFGVHGSKETKVNPCVCRLDSERLHLGCCNLLSSALYECFSL